MRSKKNHLKKFVSITTILVGLASLSTNGYAATAFPNVRTVRDTSDILDNYQPYLDFVVRVGNEVDASSTRKMVASFTELKKRNPEAAARFLKGLRFELVDKAERMGRRTVSLTSQNPEMQKWVGRFIKEWAREADEHLYRVTSSQIAKK
ncbi:MAG: hypothetical protein EBQ92_02595 [Proteobacteria bacterium]|nr:hypothetical protein [Pseudomonadota bacterium]